MHRSSLSEVSRRRSLSGCAACAGCTAGVLLSARIAAAKEEAKGKPRIRLVFCETTNDKPIWPNIGYDFDARRKQVLTALTQGCRDVQFLACQVMDNPQHVESLPHPHTLRRPQGGVQPIALAAGLHDHHIGD